MAPLMNRFLYGAKRCWTSVLLNKQNTKVQQAARKAAERRKAYPANTVILHQVWRGPYAPSLSPFPLKLETYLRMAKIPYQNEHGKELSSKSKTPWITYNGEDIADSEFCIKYLNKELQRDPNSYINKEQRAIARSMQQMMEGSFYWVFLLQRWVYNLDNYRFLKIAIPTSELSLKQFSKPFVEQADCQGYGRHTTEEVHSIGHGDLKALSDFLGTKVFLLGDQPCQEDCAIFGMLAQVKWHAPGTPLEKMFKADFTNLSDYCERMKDRFWPDWDECNTAGGTKQPTK